MMTKLLSAAYQLPRLLSPTTTAKLATRMLAASNAIAALLPPGLHGTPALDILLSIHVAEEAASYPAVDSIKIAGFESSSVTQRFVKALVHEGLIDQRGSLLALSPAGHAVLMSILEAVYEAQRSLD
jgi:hypothetical protein